MGLARRADRRRPGHPTQPVMGESRERTQPTPTPRRDPWGWETEDGPAKASPLRTARGGVHPGRPCQVKLAARVRMPGLLKSGKSIRTNIDQWSTDVSVAGFGSVIFEHDPTCQIGVPARPALRHDARKEADSSSSRQLRTVARAATAAGADQRQHQASRLGRLSRAHHTGLAGCDFRGACRIRGSRRRATQHARLPLWPETPNFDSYGILDLSFPRVALVTEQDLAIHTGS